MKKKKIITTMFIVAIFNLLLSNFSLASQLSVYKVQYNKNENRYISYNDISQRFFDYYYIDESGSRKDVYCKTLSKDGAEKTTDGYEVYANEYESDQNIINILNNGYPHKSYTELGLEDENQAKFATQFALWVYTNNLDISKIGNINDKSELVKQAIINIYNSKDKVVNQDTTFNIEKVSSEIITVSNVDYYKIKFSLQVGRDIISIDKAIKDKNIRIVDEKLNDIENLTNKSEIFALYPVKLVDKNKNIDLKFIAKYKNLKVKAGVPVSSTMQDVAMILAEYEEKEIVSNVEIKYDKLELEINKTDDSKIPLQGVKFLLYNNETGEVLGEYVTDKAGKIKIDFRKDLNIHDDISVRVQEISVPEGYLLNNTPIIVKLKYGKCIALNIVNQKAPVETKIELPKTGM